MLKAAISKELKHSKQIGSKSYLVWQRYRSAPIHHQINISFVNVSTRPCLYTYTAGPNSAYLRGQGMECPPRCHQVGKFLAKVMDQRLNTRFFKKKITFLLEPQFSCARCLLKTRAIDKYSQIFVEYTCFF